MSLLERNLEALAPWTPATAALVAAAVIPADYEPTTGTDGTPTFCRRIDDPAGRRLDWLGAVSMPRAAAEALVASFDVSQGNGLGLSIGTGYEWDAFIRRLSPAQAVFVYEPDAAHLRMALDIWDLSTHLRQGKLVLLTGSQEVAANELSQFLSTHIGFEVPSVLQPLPTLVGEGRNSLLATGEAIVRRAVTERQLLINSLAGRIESVMQQLTDQVVAITLTPRYAGERPLREELYSAVPELRIDHHASTSLAARLRFIADHRPHTILSDFFRPQLACVPHTIAVETWIPPLIGAAFWTRLPAAGALAPTDRIIVHAGVHQDRLAKHGISPEQTALRPIRPAPVTVHVAAPLAIRHRVAMLADLPATDPASLGIELPTHLAVYSAACDLIITDYLTVAPTNAADILRRSLARAGVSSGTDGPADPALREPMLRILRDVLIPSLPLLTLARTLIDNQFSLRLIGDWAGLGRPASEQVAIEPFPATAGVHWDDVAVLAHLSPDGVVSPLLWEAVAAGVAIVAPQHPADAQPGALPSLLRSGKEYAYPAPMQFLPTLKALLRDGARRTQFAAAAQRRPTPAQ